MSRPPYDGVVLAGGRSRRMQVQDKTRLVVGGRSLLDRAVAALSGAETVVVVGAERRTDIPVRWTIEEPAGSGPAAALRTGLDDVSAPVVVLLAADLPFVTCAHVEALVDGLDADVDGAVYVDDTGREQWLCGAWQAAVLRDAELVPNAALRDALSVLRVRRLVPTATGPQVWFDCDTPDDLHRAEELLS